MAANPEHYSMRVTAMRVRIVCGDHFFMRDGLQEGPCICPGCGRRFALTWSANVGPWVGSSVEVSGEKGTHP